MAAGAVRTARVTKASLTAGCGPGQGPRSALLVPLLTSSATEAETSNPSAYAYVPLLWPWYLLTL